MRTRCQSSPLPAPVYEPSRFRVRREAWRSPTVACGSSRTDLAHEPIGAASSLSTLLRCTEMGQFDPGSIDPASAYTSSLWRILIMTNDGLVGFRRVGGLQGANLVPDLATFIPAPTDGGLTYTFRVRRGVRFSDGQQVLASDFLFALVRDVKVESLPETPQPADFDLIPYLLGGPSCSLHPDTCSLAWAVQADNSTGEVAFHLRKPDPDFLYQLALPFADPLPPTTSVRLPSGGTVPATGPYRILSSPARAGAPPLQSGPGTQPVLSPMVRRRPARRLSGPHRHQHRARLVERGRRRGERQRGRLVGLS